MKKLIVLFSILLGVGIQSSFAFAEGQPIVTSIVMYPGNNSENTFLVKGKNLVREENGVQVPNFKFQLLYANEGEKLSECNKDNAMEIGRSLVGTPTPTSVAFKYMFDLRKRSWKLCLFDFAGNVIKSDEHQGHYVDECRNSLNSENGVAFLKAHYYISKKNNILRLNTSQCKSNHLRLALYDRPTYNVVGSDNYIDVRDNKTNEVLQVLDFVPQENEVRISYETDDEECSGLRNPDCRVWVEIRDENGNILFHNRGVADEYIDQYKAQQNQTGEKAVIEAAASKGVILGECTSGHCRAHDWTLLGIQGANNMYSSIYVQTETPDYDTKSKCYKQELNEGKGGYDPNCYEFLAPIDFDVNGGNLKGVKSEDGHTWIENIRDFRFGDYVNFLFRIAISALVIISVVMIMVAGIEYMTVESIFGRSQAKARIKNAMGGLILALASYTILYTINPNLVDIGALDNMDVAKIDGVGGDPDPNDSTIQNVGEKQCVMVESPWGAPQHKLNQLGIKCGSNYSLSDIAQSFVGHVTYRYGAKGGKFPSNTTACLIDGTNKDDKCKNDKGEMQRCGDFCPSDSICLDCSGFVYEVLRCKGMNPKRYGSGDYFGSRCENERLEITGANKQGNDITITYKDSSGIAGSYTLKEGDLFGAPNHHVAMYVGEGKFVDSQPGRINKNTAVKLRDFLATYRADMKKSKRKRWMRYILPLDRLKNC